MSKEKRAAGPLEQELQVVLSHPLGLLQEQQALLTLVPFLQPLEKVSLELVWSSQWKC